MHIHEILLDSWNVNGAELALVRWSDSTWCGKLAYAENNTDEPDVEKLAEEAVELFENIPAKSQEKNWEVCISLNYLSDERPNGVMFGFGVGTRKQDPAYDILQIPTAEYMRIQLCDATFRALKVEPWEGGIPPHEWIGEMLAPRYGYRYGSDTLPIVEYYLIDEDDGHVIACYLYVPVEKAE